MSSLDFDLDMQAIGLEATADGHAYVEVDVESSLLERRWFAALNSARSAQSECDVLREVMDQAESAWRSARARLERLEKLRDALGEDLAALDMIKIDDPPCRAERREARSAA